MYVITRNGSHEEVDFNKIADRIARLCKLHPPLNATFVDPVRVAQKVVASMATGMSTQELDTLSAETAAAMSLEHPHYSLLAGRIAVSNLHRQTEKYGRTFSETVEYLFSFKQQQQRQQQQAPGEGPGEEQPGEAGGPAAGLVSKSFRDCVMRHREALDAAIVHARDFELLDFFAYRTLAKTYLLTADAKDENKILERPQYLYMRVAVQIHGDDVARVLESYDLLSRQMFSHATPTMHSAGLPKNQLSSCFLLPIQSDSIEGIFHTVQETAIISKYGGGVGLSAHHIRAAGTRIESTNGTSTGLVPMLRVYNTTAKYVDQGGGKRNGSFAIYLEPWHADVEDFLELRNNQGAEEHRARDLFYGLWVPDLFMKRVEENGNWSLFCPKKAPGLHAVHGAAFEELYLKYEATPGLANKTVRAVELWLRIISAQIETGMPYILYKDACNRKSNHQHLGTITCSNLCTEIVQYSSPDEIAVCNLASIALPKFVGPEGPAAGQQPSAAACDGEEEGQSGQSSAADSGCAAASAAEARVQWDELARVTRVVTRNLNLLIDKSFYPLEKMRVSNLRHRPMGIGVQGLADMYAMLGLPYESEAAAAINRRVFETMYLAAMDESCTLAEEAGEPYPSYPGSPLSRGLLQMDLWSSSSHAAESCCPENAALLAKIRARLPKTGARNSLLMAPMPTASTAQIMGNTEGTQAFPFMLFTRRVKSGEFTVVNKHLVAALEARGLWTPEIQRAIVANGGSVQSISVIPESVREVFKTTWEIKQRAVIDQAADRGRFICQSQSMNVFVAEPTVPKLTALHLHAWRKGLKTGMYYLHTRPKTEPVKFTLVPAAAKEKKTRKQEEASEEMCEHCSA